MKISMIQEQCCKQNTIISVFRNFVLAVLDGVKAGWSCEVHSAINTATLHFSNGSVKAKIEVIKYSEILTSPSIRYAFQNEEALLILKVTIDDGFSVKKKLIYDDYQLEDILEHITNLKPIYKAVGNRVYIDAAPVDFKPFIMPNLKE